MQIFVKNLEGKSIAYDGIEYENVNKLVCTVSEREKRTDSLIKRIKRLQWKQLESHTTEQLESFYERQVKLLPVSNSNNNNCHDVLKLEPNNISQLDKPTASTRFSNCPSSQSSSQLESQDIQTQTQTTQTTSTVAPITPINYLSQTTVQTPSSSQLSSTLDPPKDSSSSLPHELLQTTNPLTPSNKNGEINLIPTGDIKLSGGSSVSNLLDKQQNSGLQSSNVTTNNPTTSSGSTDKPIVPDKPLTSNKPNLPSEVTLPKPKADSKQSKRSNPGRSTTNVPPVVNQIVNNFTPSILDCAEDELLRSAVGIITANLKHLEYSYDSDATESSSGGESCDEFENVFSDTFSKTNTRSNILEPIERKANWRWLNERSAIASRWTWLQAQVADLEFKIRQQNEMYRQLRASKGSIAFYCKEAPTNNSTLIPNSLTKSSITTPRTSSSSIWTQQPTCSTSLAMSTSPSTASTPSSTPKTSLPTKPCIQIPPITLTTPPSTPNLDSLDNASSVTTTTTTTTTSTTTTTTSTATTSTTTTDSLSIDVSSFKFAKNSPSSSSSNNNSNNNNNGKFINMLGSNNGTLNTQGNLSSSSGPNSNGLSDYSLPSVNSDSTISLSPPLETMAASSSRTNSPPPPSNRLPSSFESSLQASTSTSTTSTSTTITCQSSSNPTSTTTFSSSTSTTIATTTTATCTTTASLAITPQKQPGGGFVKDSTTPSSEERHDIVSNSEKEIHHCARTLPLKQMRKRKLVRSCNAISTASRKIARYSTVQCSCSNYPKFVSPCVLCNGRFSHLQMVDTDCMPNYERYALLDPSYHPVLSLSTDVALGLYFAKILKKEATAVQKPLKSRITGTTIATSTSSTLSALSSTSAAPPPPAKTKSANKSRSTHSEFPFKFGQDNKKTQLNRGKSQAIISSTKLKKKYDGTTKKKYAKKNNNLRKRNFRVKNDQTNGEFPSPLSSENSHTPIHRRRRSEQYTYDINNIVIPYSIASTTRVEKLQYKEIITPKWRFVETDQSTNNSSNNDNKESKETIGDVKPNQQNLDNSVEKNNIFKFDHEGEETDEDISDEAFAIRHAKCEIDERKQRNLHLHQKSTTTTTKNHHPHSPSTEIISSLPSLTQNSHAQTFQ